MLPIQGRHAFVLEFMNCLVRCPGTGLTSLDLSGLDYHVTDEGVAALGARDPATGAHRLGGLRQLSLSGCVKLSGRGLGRLPPGLEALRLGFCSNLKVCPAGT